ncbi:tetratricopeptide repeat (TPR)-like superfamily protein [Actinidia rufa]|uniref:Tetratricopeptide repeat (TPR)-like superfamily protein n=1 Tax=Actinidia rufa TaxID=165716 RepID=A0A7J0EMU0_9ERIC|nr:tetratricopeptide repeat (TPR)-like superfamily protein [Actinidia rufa]
MIKTHLSFSSDWSTYHVLLSQSRKSDDSSLSSVRKILDLVATDGFTPDKATTDIAIRTLCNNGRGSEVLWVYKKMKEESAESDLVTYNTLVFGLSKSGRVKEAKKFLGVMAEMGHFPDDVTYTSLMNGMCREGNALGALQLLEEMEAKGVSPNSCTYNTLRHRNGRVAEAYEVFDLQWRNKETLVLLAIDTPSLVLPVVGFAVPT